MLSWFRALMPKEDRCFPLFEAHAKTLVGGAEALVQLLNGGPDTARWCVAVSEQEEAADVVTRDTLLAVRRTFITPFDRSDIQALTTSLDDAIDQMQKTAKTVRLFEIDQFEPAMREMGAVILEASQRTNEAVPLLRSLGENSGRLNALTEEVIKLEGRADDIHGTGLKALYLSSRSDPMDFIVKADIYDHLERVMDRFEDVANQMSSILVEHI